MAKQQSMKTIDTPLKSFQTQLSQKANSQNEVVIEVPVFIKDLFSSSVSANPI